MSGQMDLVDRCVVLAERRRRQRAIRAVYSQNVAIRLWARWKLVAHKAAEFQGQALFFLLYFVMLLPMAFVLSLKSALFGGAASAIRPPQWRERHDEPPTVDAVRRQF
jgi:hypothetical protein